MNMKAGARKTLVCSELSTEKVLKMSNSIQIIIDLYNPVLTRL